jgi:hypothetical protein
MQPSPGAQDPVPLRPPGERAPDEATAARAARQPRDRAAEPFTGSDLSMGIGCAVIALGFLLTGPFFLWAYFSDVPTKRGNPVMALVGGLLFTAVGLLALVVALKGRWGSGRR